MAKHKKTFSIHILLLLYFHSNFRQRRLVQKEHEKSPCTEKSSGEREKWQKVFQFTPSNGTSFNVRERNEKKIDMNKSYLLRCSLCCGVDVSEVDEAVTVAGGRPPMSAHR